MTLEQKVIDNKEKDAEYQKLIVGVYDRYERRELNKYQLHKILHEAWDKAHLNKN